MASSDPAPTSPQSISRGRRIRVGIGLAALVIGSLVIALVVWLPTTAEKPPVARPDETSEPSETPDPEPDGTDVPQALVEVGCDDLVSPAEVSATLGTDAVAESSSPVRNGVDALLRQAGIGRCTWSAGDRELGLVVAVDPKLFDVAMQDARESTIDGRRVSELCSVDEDAVCRLDVSWGEIYVSLRLSGSDADQVQARLRALVPSVVGAVTAAPVATPEWTPPPTSLTSAAVHAVPPSALGDALGLVDAEVWGGEAGAVTFRALTATDSSSFRFGDDSARYVDLLVVAGGAWALDELLVSGYAPLDVEGVERAALARAPDPLSGGLVACMEVDRSLVCLTTQETDAGRLAAGLSSFARALLA